MTIARNAIDDVFDGAAAVLGARSVPPIVVTQTIGTGRFDRHRNAIEIEIEGTDLAGGMSAVSRRSRGRSRCTGRTPPPMGPHRPGCCHDRVPGLPLGRRH